MASKYAIVPISPKTGKELRRPHRGQEVYYAVKSPRGTLKKIPQEYSQKFYSSDLKGLNSIIKRTGPENLVVYEQRAAESIPGKYRRGVKDKKGRALPQKKTKITFRQSDKEQRPVILSTAKKVKRVVQDGAFRKVTKREAVDAKLAKIIKVSTAKSAVFTKEIFLSGPTIFGTLKNVKSNVSTKDLKRAGANTLWVEGVVRVYHPKQGLLHATRFSHNIQQLRNFSQEISKEVRFKLSDVGFRFTSLAALRDFQDDLDERETGVDLFHMGYTRKPVEALKPVHPEDEDGNTVTRKGGYKVSVSLRLTGYKDPTKGKRKKKGGKKTKAKATPKKKVRKTVPKKKKPQKRKPRK